MTNINVNKKRLLSELGINYDNSKLRELISNIGTDPEDITSDEVIVEVFPNRPDLLSGTSLIRALKFYLNKIKPYEYRVNSPDKNFKVIVDSSVSSVRPFTVCAVVKNISLTDSRLKELIQLQEKLHLTFGRDRKKLAIGIYPLDKIKMPIHYRADKPESIRFVPLDMDYELSANEILLKHPTGRKYAELLNGKPLFPYFIDSNNNVLSLPPIINSELTGRVSLNTKDLFIECSGFNLDVLNDALNIITTIFYDMGADIYQVDIEYSSGIVRTPDLSFKELKFDKGYAEKVLGMSLNDNDVDIALSKMGYIVRNNKIFVPPYRTDILHKIDVVEDIAIGFGYDNFIAEIPKISSVASVLSINKLKSLLVKILVGLSMIELKNLDIINDVVQTKYVKFDESPVMLLSSVSKEYNSLRTNLLSSMLLTLKSNLNNDVDSALFEIGTTFHHDPDSETNVREETHLGVIVYGNFTRLKQILNVVFSALNIGFELRESDYEFFIKGRQGDIILKKDSDVCVGMIGELHPEVILNFDLKSQVSFFDINLEKLLDILK